MDYDFEVADVSTNESGLFAKTIVTQISKPRPDWLLRKAQLEDGQIVNLGIVNKKVNSRVGETEDAT